MKTLRSLKVVCFACILLNLAMLNSCKNPAEDVSIKVNTNIFKSPTVLQFKNANPNGSTPNNLSLTFTGAGANLVRTITGGTNFNVSNGFINIVLDRNANPSTANPVKVTATVNAPGYAPSYLELTFTDPEAKQFHTIEMLQYSRPAEGTAAVVRTQALVGGQTAAPVTVATTPNATQPQSTTLAIPANTAFKDAAGTTINGNQIETRIVYTALNNQGSLSSDFGLTPITNAVNANGQPIAGTVKAMPITYASINMFSGTTSIKSFTNPINLDMELPAGGINPNTGVAFVAGDVFDIWSINESTGQWTQEGTAPVVLNNSNKLVIRKAITHLTGYAATVSTVTKTMNVTITRNFIDEDEYFTINNIRSTQTVMLKAGESTKTFTITFEGNQRMVESLIVTAAKAGVYKSTSQVSILGVGTTFNNTFNFAKIDNGINAVLALTIKCNDKNLSSAANLALKFVDLNTGEESIITVDDGVATGIVQNGRRYRVYAEFDGVSYSTTFTVNNGTAVIDAVENLSASVSPLSGGGFKVDATITKKCN